jgi:hypothetical protein
MDYNAMGRCLGGIYISLCSALTEEAAELAHEHLRQLSESPLSRPEDQRVYGAIVDCATRPIDEADNEPPRRRFEVIQGGNSAA